MRLQVWFDGSCGPGPAGTAAYGYIVKNENGDTVHCGYGRVGHGASMSSNVGEYEGLYQAMLFIHRNYPYAETLFRGDSTLVITQMKGESKAKKGRYLPYYRKSIELARPYIEAKRWEFTWVQRALNSEADDLAQYERY